VHRGKETHASTGGVSLRRYTRVGLAVWPKTAPPYKARWRQRYLRAHLKKGGFLPALQPVAASVLQQPAAMPATLWRGINGEGQKALLRRNQAGQGKAVAALQMIAQKGELSRSANSCAPSCGHWMKAQHGSAHWFAGVMQGSLAACRGRGRNRPGADIAEAGRGFLRAHAGPSRYAPVASATGLRGVKGRLPLTALRSGQPDAPHR